MPEILSNASSNFNQCQSFFQEVQKEICAELEKLDSKERFFEEIWQHAEGGGGVTRVLQQGNLFEKGGVNTSAVSGTLTDLLANRLTVPPQGFFASGISLVIHPLSPLVPTVHANFRYLELESGDAWFGGGSDLTPYYLFEEDARHFHSIWQQTCDRHDSTYYPKFKRSCDEYFTIKHRKEARGIGGIFFDYLKGDFERLFSFVQECGRSFLPAYVPIVERRKHEQWGEREREWQLHRRGRYVEFNLIYDRGTLFGLETQGRSESILMSLPPLVRWGYDVRPEPRSRESQLLEVLQNPREWL